MRSLRAYLAILILGAMLPGSVLTGILVWRAFVNTRAISERRLLESARVDAAAVDREFASAMGVLEALATSPPLERGDLQAFYAEARRVRDTQPGWYSITLVSRDARQLLTTGVEWGTPLAEAREPESLERLITTGRPTVGPIRQAPRGDAAHIFAIRVPVLVGGELQYALSAVLDVTALGRVVSTALTDDDEWTRTIIDPEGTIAVRTRGSDTYVGTSTTEQFREQIDRAPEAVTSGTTREGIPVYAATSRGTHGWTAVILVPRTALDGPLNASLLAFLTGGAMLMACGLAAALFVSRRLSDDLAAATTAAAAVAEGRPWSPRRGYVAETGRLQRSLASAAALLDQRGRERDEQIRVAEEANRTKDQFLAVLGHELRNPLAPAVTALELMRMRNPDDSRRERQVLERQIAHMTRLVDDLLDLSRLTRGRLEIVRAPFDLRESIARAVDMVQPQLMHRRHTLTTRVPDEPLIVNGDIDRIVQVLTNLLTNAIRYTPAAGSIGLTALRSDDRVRVSCEDNGPGIPPELVPTLFEPFIQGPRTSDRPEGGLGLGLALARTFTERHGGTLSVEAVETGGSRFIVRLPLVVGSTASAPSAFVSADAKSHAVPRTLAGVKRRILIVDDNDDAAEMLRLLLTEEGHEVATAPSGPVALQLAADMQPEIGILDLGLPGMDGYEVAGRLRQVNHRIHLIALSGYGQPADVDATMRAGFLLHFTKPIAMTSLLQTLSQLSPS